MTKILVRENERAKGRGRGLKEERGKLTSKPPPRPLLLSNRQQPSTQKTYKIDSPMSLNTTLDVMVLLGDSITEGSWAKEGLSTRLAGELRFLLPFFVRALPSSCSPLPRTELLLSLTSHPLSSCRVLREEAGRDQQRLRRVHDSRPPPHRRGSLPTHHKHRSP